MACSTFSGSNLASTTTVPPSAMLASASGPAAWVIGAATRFTGGRFIGIEATRLETSACQLPLVSITPLERPVVPPVLARKPSSSASPARRWGTGSALSISMSSIQPSVPVIGRSMAI